MASECPNTYALYASLFHLPNLATCSSGNPEATYCVAPPVDLQNHRHDVQGKYLKERLPLLKE